MTNKLFDLSGKTALVTGGNKGIGRGMAIGLAQAGADIIIASRSIEANSEIEQEVKNWEGISIFIRWMLKTGIMSMNLFNSSTPIIHI